MHAKFEQPTSKRLGVSGIAQRDVSQTRVDPCHRASVAQAANPAPKRSTFYHFNHLRNVNCSSHFIKRILKFETDNIAAMRYFFRPHAFIG